MDKRGVEGKEQIRFNRPKVQEEGDPSPTPPAPAPTPELPGSCCASWPVSQSPDLAACQHVAGECLFPQVLAFPSFPGQTLAGPQAPRDERGFTKLLAKD